MTRYARFDHAAEQPAPIIGYYDTEVLQYPVLPDAVDLIEMSDDEWDARTLRPWAVQDGQIVPYDAPPPVLTLPQQAAGLLAGGLTVTSAAASFTATFACDATAQSHIQAEIISVMLNGTFADGADMVNWPDTSSPAVGHPMDIATFRKFASAIGAFVAACVKVISGTSTSLPSNEVTID